MTPFTSGVSLTLNGLDSVLRSSSSSSSSNTALASFFLIHSIAPSTASISGVTDAGGIAVGTKLPVVVDDVAVVVDEAEADNGSATRCDVNTAAMLN